LSIIWLPKTCPEHSHTGKGNARAHCLYPPPTVVQLTRHRHAPHAQSIKQCPTVRAGETPTTVRQKPLYGLCTSAACPLEAIIACTPTTATTVHASARRRMPGSASCASIDARPQRRRCQWSARSRCWRCQRCGREGGWRGGGEGFARKAGWRRHAQHSGASHHIGTARTVLVCIFPTVAAICNIAPFGSERRRWRRGRRLTRANGAPLLFRKAVLAPQIAQDFRAGRGGRRWGGWRSLMQRI